MRFLSLFSGIGGFDLGLERAGMKCVGQVEIDPYCRAVLAKHWPDVPKMEDVRDVRGDEFGEFEYIVGGFPCQDVSNAGRRAGLSGERSGLYRELVRCLRVVRPLGAVLENVAALLARGMGTVLGDLAESGYNTEWDCIPACAVGAPHRRDRIWITAHARQPGLSADMLEPRGASCCRVERSGFFQGARWLYESTRQLGRWMDAAPEASVAACAWEYAPCEPLLLGVPDGVSKRVDRIAAIGNAVVPQVAEVVGRSIMETTQEQRR